MLRKVIIGTVGVGVLMPVVGIATPNREPVDPAITSQGPAKPPKMRPSELPIYDAPHAAYNEYVQSVVNKPKPGVIKSFLLTPVRAVREQVQVVVNHTDHAINSVQTHYHEFQDRTDWIVKYLREEENKEIRYGAVVMGGLSGFIFGLRGGFVRRTLYATAGTTFMGLICFPEETKGILSNNSEHLKQYINIAYNFLYGVKPGDPQLEVKFPELSFPKDLKELTALSTSLVASIKQAVMPPPAKEESKQEEIKKQEDKKQ